MPQTLSNHPALETGFSVLQAELLAEQAAALGRLGRELEAALAALRVQDAGGGESNRHALVGVAADALWRLLVQCEASDLYDQAAVVRDYAVPREVLKRVGVR